MSTDVAIYNTTHTKIFRRKGENRDDDSKMKFSVILMLLSIVRMEGKKQLESLLCVEKRSFKWGNLPVLKPYEYFN